MSDVNKIIYDKYLTGEGPYLVEIKSMILAKNSFNEPIVKVLFENKIWSKEWEFTPNELMNFLDIGNLRYVLPFAYFFFVGEEVEVEILTENFVDGEKVYPHSHIYMVEDYNDNYLHDDCSLAYFDKDDVASLDLVFGVTRDELAEDFGIDPSEVKDWHYFEGNGY